MLPRLMPTGIAPQVIKTPEMNAARAIATSLTFILRRPLHLERVASSPVM